MPESFDHRAFVRIDHGMPDNPKVVGLSDSAFRLYVEAICWSSRQETDGLILTPVMRKLGPAKAFRDLVTAGLLDVHPEGHQIHDYLDFQRSSEEITAFRNAKGKAGAAGNHARWHVARRKRDDDCEFCLREVPDAIAN